MNADHFETVKRAGDVFSLGAVLAVFVDYAPHIAAVLAVVWWVIRIYYEIRTGQRSLRRK